TLNFVPKMDAARLVEGYKMILRTIYSPGEYYRRSLDCLERVVTEVPEPRRSGLIGDAAALARVILRLGVLDRERREFWRYLYRVLFRHREKFAVAVEMAAIGYHFRRVTESYCSRDEGH